MFKTPGAPTPQSVSQLGMDAQMRTKGPSYKYTWNIPRDQPSAKTEFPMVHAPADAYDDIAMYKQAYSTAAAGSNWVVPFERSDAEYLRRKRDAMEKADFDIWVNQKYNLTDPAQNLMLQNIAPELYQRREEIIDQQQDLVSRYAKMRLRGAKSIEDLQFEWRIDTGRIELPQGPIWNPMAWRHEQLGQPGGPAADMAANRTRFISGFFSPLKILSAANAAKQANPANYFDITGSSVPLEPTWYPRYNTDASMRSAYSGNYASAPLYANQGNLRKEKKKKSKYLKTKTSNYSKRCGKYAITYL